MDTNDTKEAAPKKDIRELEKFAEDYIQYLKDHWGELLEEKVPEKYRKDERFHQTKTLLYQEGYLDFHSDGKWHTLTARGRRFTSFDDARAVEEGIEAMKKRNDEMKQKLDDLALVN